MASVNGKQVYQLSDALYFPGVGIVAESGGLYISNADGKTKLQLTLRNVGMDTLSALQINIRCMDVFGNDLGEFQHQYIDLTASTGKSFGSNVLVDVPQGNTRSIQLVITAVIYANGQSWRQERGENGIALPKAQPLPYSQDALAEFRARTNCANAVDMPQTTEGLWRCTCGAWTTHSFPLSGFVRSPPWCPVFRGRRGWKPLNWCAARWRRCAPILSLQ